MLSTILNNAAAGSTTATPATGSAAVDYVTGLPAKAVRVVSGFLGTLGS